jgi:DNA-binding transcriptional LysR family regulator
MLARPTAGPVVSQQLTGYKLRLYAAAEHTAANGSVEAVADLRRHVLVGYIADLLYAPELRHLEEIDDSLSPALRSSSINAQYRMIASGAGVGVLPRFIGDADATLRPVLAANQIERAFWLVTHRDTRDLRRIRTFADWLITAVARRQALFIGRD